MIEITHCLLCDLQIIPKTNFGSEKFLQCKKCIVEIRKPDKYIERDLKYTTSSHYAFTINLQNNILSYMSIYINIDLDYVVNLVITNKHLSVTKQGRNFHYFKYSTFDIQNGIELVDLNLKNFTNSVIKLINKLDSLQILL